MEQHGKPMEILIAIMNQIMISIFWWNTISIHNINEVPFQQLILINISKHSIGFITVSNRAQQATSWVILAHVKLFSHRDVITKFVCAENNFARHKGSQFDR